MEEVCSISFGGMPMLFVQGFFFQLREVLNIVEMGAGRTSVMVSNDLFQSMYSGVLHHPEESLSKDTLVGSMVDYFGTSVISKVHYEKGRKLSYQKKYEQRQDVIDYSFVFSEQHQMYIGKYTGSAAGTGLTACIVTEVSNAMLTIGDLLDFTQSEMGKITFPIKEVKKK